MNVTRRCTLAVLLASALVGCSTAHQDIQVDSDFDPETNFGTYRSYAWAAMAAVVHDPEREWAPPDLDIGAEITFLVNRELRDRGMTEAVDAPDVLVLYAVGVDMKALELVTPEEGAEHFEEIPRGALVVVLFDPASRQVLWVASAVADLLEEPSVEQSKARLDYAVTTMFKDFPRSR